VLEFAPLIAIPTLVCNLKGDSVGFFKSLFGGSKPAPIAEMSGVEYSIVDMFTESSFTLEKLAPFDPPSPWTEEKQMRFLFQFAGQNFAFDGEVGCMLIVYFDVDRHLKGKVKALLYKETAKEYLEYRESWGERPEDIGRLDLEFWQEKPCVKVWKNNAPEGHPSLWKNQHWKDKDAYYNSRR
jgi:hypothetical protein